MEGGCTSFCKQQGATDGCGAGSDKDEQLPNLDKDYLNQNFLASLLKYRFPGPTHGDSNSVGLGWARQWLFSMHSPGGSNVHNSFTALQRMKGFQEGLYPWVYTLPDQWSHRQQESQPFLWDSCSSTASFPRKASCLPF